MLHGNLQMSKIFQSYTATTDLLKKTHITDILQIDIKYITACYNIPAIYMFSFFSRPRTDNNPFPFH